MAENGSLIVGFVSDSRNNQGRHRGVGTQDLSSGSGIIISEMTALSFERRLAGQGEGVQIGADLPPGRHEAVENRNESVVVAWRDEVGDLVQDDLIEILRRLLGQIQIDPNGFLAGVAATPFGLHALAPQSVRKPRGRSAHLAKGSARTCTSRGRRNASKGGKQRLAGDTARQAASAEVKFGSRVRLRR